MESMTGESVGARFERGPNALNFIRLCLALWVIGFHAYSLRESTGLPPWAYRFSADVAVDAFFAISGFLICRAWLRRPRLAVYAGARARRILPGLWVCLLVTAFVIAPLATWAAGRPGLLPGGQWSFVVGNADAWVSQYGIGDGPVGVPRPGSWNGSLWSLGYEMASYVAVALLGRLRLLNPLVVVGIAFTAWASSAALLAGGFEASGTWFWLAPRCALMFACGALLFLWGGRIRLSARVAALAAVVLVGAAVFVPADYRLVGAPALAYLCLAVGVWLGRFPRLVLRNDLSYGVYVYAFPVQQALLMVGVVRGGWLGFVAMSVACTLPLAALSWFLVERPVTRLRWAQVRGWMAAPSHQPSRSAGWTTVPSHQPSSVAD